MTPFAALRASLGWTLIETAARLKCSRRTAQHWEAGDHEPPPAVIMLMEIWADGRLR